MRERDRERERERECVCVCGGGGGGEGGMKGTTAACILSAISHQVRFSPLCTTQQSRPQTDGNPDRVRGSGSAAPSRA